MRVLGRSPQEIMNDAAAIRADADRVAKFMRMGIQSGNIDFDGLPRASDTAKHSAGTTNFGTGGPGRPTTVEIWVATELLQVRFPLSLFQLRQ